ncbi:MAG: PLP-dependent aminotransferase family protein [Pseudomonadales bacterium]
MPAPRYKTIVERFAQAIRRGELVPGTQLPTHRNIAKREGIALATATKVYAELEAMGLVIGETGRGTFVRHSALPLGNGIDQSAVLAKMIDLNFNSGALPTQEQLLRTALAELSENEDLSALLHYQPHAGGERERAVIASHLTRRGLSAHPAQLLITSGAQHALAVVAMALFNPGDIVAVDALTYPGFKAVAELYRLELAPIPITKDGPDFNVLQDVLQRRQVKAIYCMPTLHNPLGWVLDLQQRQQLIALASESGALLLEDAAYAFLAADPPPPLAELAPQNTVYISGLSKNIATGMRLGFICAPPAVVGKLERAIRATTWNTPALITALCCRWIEDGTVDSLERQKRDDAIARQAMARSILCKQRWVSSSSAPFMWLELPTDIRADTLACELAAKGVSVSTASPFSCAAQTPQALRLALSSPSLEELEFALHKVADEMQNYRYL